jgi:hypothetical protein
MEFFLACRLIFSKRTIKIIKKRGNSMDITALMLAERERIEGELQKELLEFEQSKYPEGRLKTMKNGNYYKYYQAVNTSSGVKWK